MARAVEGLDWAWCRTCGAGAGVGFVGTMGDHLHHFVVQRKSDGKYRGDLFDGQRERTYWTTEMRDARISTKTRAEYHVVHGKNLQAVPIPADMEKGFRDPRSTSRPELKRVEL